MPRLKYMEIPRADISTTPIVAGQIIYAVDTNECFYDNSNTIRILSEDIAPINSINSVSTPEHNKLYIDRHAYIDPYGIVKYQGPEYATLYIYNSLANWQQVTDTSEVNSFISSYTEMEPSVLNENGKNKAPVTLANLVYTSDGDNLEDLVKEIKVLKVFQEELVVDDADTKIFQVNPPFKEYFKYPNRNFAIVSINGIVQPQSYYRWIEGNRLQFYNRVMTLGRNT